MVITKAKGGYEHLGLVFCQRELGGITTPLRWNYDLRVRKFAQSWVELQPHFGGITTRGWVKLPGVGWNYNPTSVELRPAGGVKFAQS